MCVPLREVSSLRALVLLGQAFNSLPLRLNACLALPALVACAGIECKWCTSLAKAQAEEMQAKALPQTRQGVKKAASPSVCGEWEEEDSGGAFEPSYRVHAQLANTPHVSLDALHGLCVLQPHTHQEGRQRNCACSSLARDLTRCCSCAIDLPCRWQHNTPSS